MKTINKPRWSIRMKVIQREITRYKNQFTGSPFTNQYYIERIQKLEKEFQEEFNKVNEENNSQIFT